MCLNLLLVLSSIILTIQGENHFPSQPQLPLDQGGVFFVVSTNATVHERSLLATDMPGSPLDNDDNIDEIDIIIADLYDNLDEDAIEGERFEGDISGVFLAGLDLLDPLRSNGDNRDTVIRNAIVNSYQKWPRGEIPYVISSSFDKHARAVIYKAMNEFRLNSCVRWRHKRPGDRYYVHILKDKGCYSRVGRTRESSGQVLSLGRGCVNVGTVVHEMLHAAGFWHEQSRPDRDAHVKVLWQNIKDGKEDNFARYSRGEVSTLELPYDPRSVMHYRSKAFTRNGKPTLANRRGQNGQLGQKEGPTPLDIRKLNTLYECPTEVKLTTIEQRCVDKSQVCQSWKKQLECNQFSEYMKKVCPRTCNLCKTITKPIVPPGGCYDRDDRCTAWARFNSSKLCRQNFDFMAKTCPRACGHCTVKDRSNDQSSARSNQACILFVLIGVVVIKARRID